MPRFDVQILIDQSAGQLLGKNVQCQCSAMLQVSDNALSPANDIGCRCGLMDSVRGSRVGMDVFDVPVQVAIFQQHTQGKMAT